MKKIVVTGATSMTGVALIEALIRDSEVEKIYLVVREDTDKWYRIPIDRRIVRINCPMSQYLYLPELINDSCDCFYHFAWTRTSTYQESAEDILIKCQNISGVVSAVEAAIKLGCKKFIWAGSQSEYGIVEGIIKPNTPCYPVRADGIAHYAAGLMGKLLAENNDIAFIWMRIFSAYGKYDRANSLISSTIRKLKNGEHCSFTKSEQLWDYVNSKDMGRAFYLVGKMVNTSKIYCVGSGEEHPLWYYIEMIREIVAPDAVLGIGELPYPDKPIMRLCADIDSLTRDTGWVPQVSFVDGIKELTNAFDI